MDKVAKEMGHEVVSLDISNRYNPTYVSDILDFNFSLWPPGYFQMVWASPPVHHVEAAQLMLSRPLMLLLGPGG